MDADQIRGLKPRLDNYLSQFNKCFQRSDTRQHLGIYVNGQLSDLGQKSVEPIALKAGIPPRTLQEFLARYRWDEDAVRKQLHSLIASEHASSRSIGIIDETSDTKKGGQNARGSAAALWCGRQTGQLYCHGASGLCGGRFSHAT